MNITQNYANIGSEKQPQLVHFRRAGTGPALVMLHASPMSSAALLPFVGVAAEFCTVIAPDTPGYGCSDPLPEPGSDLTGYVAALDEFTKCLGLHSFGLYGTATGAQIAIEFSKTHGERVDYAILDNAAHFTDAERDSIVAGYFPDLTPDVTGSHLARTWSVARDQCVFFPWHQTGPDTRLPGGGVNTDVVQHMAMDFLLAGKDYDRAYRAAFANEKMERLQPVTAPTIIMRWQGSILKQYTDRFDSVEWPDNFTMLHCGPTREQRAEGFRSIFTEHMPQARSKDCHINRAGNTGNTGKGFIDLGDGQCHYQFSGDEQQSPVLALHDVGRSQRSLSARALARSGPYHVIAPDLAGHGLSQPPQAGQGGIDGVVETLAELVETLGWNSLQLQAEQDSAAIAVELAGRLGRSVTALKLVNALDYAALAGEWEQQKLCPDFTPDSEGTHLLKTWHWLRDRQLYWPWYARDATHALPGEPRLEAGYLNARLTDFWLAYPGLTELRQEIVNYPLATNLDKLDCTVELCRTRQHPLAEVGGRSLAGYS
ncbi:MAG: alpha/beta fold hydrolase [Gammaproteobacteria bacterium]|nr:alpha/beta fold hydrolase [Gammaproteobacteria bacterium]